MRKFYKNVFSVLIVLMISLLTANLLSGQTVITRWNFNGASADEVPGGATSPLPETGNGVASLAGGTTATFASGVASGGSSDPVSTSPPNYGWNSTTYPAQGTSPKTAGVAFAVSTVGYDNIIFKFDQRLSNTAANTWVAQYTTNITATSPVWVDAQTFTFEPQATGTGDVWYNERTVNLASVTALNNNANAAFRIVSAYDPTAGQYLAARSTSSYGPAGTSRFDMVTVLGNPSTSLVENALRNAKIYYNGREVMVQLPRALNGKAELFDILGNLVYSGTLNGAETSLPVYLQSAVMIVRLTDQSGAQVSRKIVIR